MAKLNSEGKVELYSQCCFQMANLSYIELSSCGKVELFFLAKLSSYGNVELSLVPVVKLTFCGKVQL